MNSKKIKIFAALLAVFAVLLTGCGYNPETVGTVNGTDIPCGRWLYCQMSALVELASEYEEAHPDDELASYTDLLDKTDDDGTSYADLLREETIALCKRYEFVEAEFENLGLKLTDEELSSNESTAQSVWSYYGQSIYEANGISYDSFWAGYQNRIKESMVREALCAEGGELEISLEEREAYYYDNFMAAEYFTLPTSVENEDGTSQAISSLYPDELEQVAEDMVATAEQSGLRAAYLAHYADALKLAGDTETVVDSAAAEEAVHTGTYSDKLGYNTEMTDALSAVEEGGYGHVLISNTMYIFKRTALTSDGESDYDDNIISLLSEEPFDEYVAEQTASYEVDIDSKAVSYYSAAKIKLS